MRARRILAAFAIGVPLALMIAIVLHGPRSEASAVTDFGLGATGGGGSGSIIPPSVIVGVVGVGQSRETGEDGVPPIDIDASGNYQLYDTYPGGADDGGWNVLDAACATCVFEPAYSAWRGLYPSQSGPPNCPSGQTGVDPWPCNTQGSEIPIEHEMRQIRTWAAVYGTTYTMWGDSYGYPAQPLTNISRGTVPYVGMTWSTGLAKAIANNGGPYYPVDAGPKGSFVIAAALMWHGETDGRNASYGSQLAAYQSNLVTDLTAITGQNRSGARCPGCIPIIAVIPANGQINGDSVGLMDLSPMEMLVLTQQSTAGKYLAACPTYQNPFHIGLTQTHNTNVGYDYGAECIAKFFWKSELWQANRAPWPTPLMPIAVNATGPGSSPAPASAFTKTSNSVAITLTGNVGSIVCDATVYQPHPAGSPYAMWAGGCGFELWSGGVQGTPVGISSVTISGNVVTVNGAASWDTVAYAETEDGLTYLDGGPYDSGSGGVSGTGPPNGVAGDIRDSDCSFTTISGHCPYDWLTTFYQAVP